METLPSKLNGQFDTPEALQPVRAQIDEIALVLADELKKRFENPDEVKKTLEKMTTDQILDRCIEILKMAKKVQVFMPKGFAVNMQQVNNYALKMAESEQFRKQIRTQARKQLRYKPS